MPVIALILVVRVLVAEKFSGMKSISRTRELLALADCGVVFDCLLLVVPALEACWAYTYFADYFFVSCGSDYLFSGVAFDFSLAFFTIWGLSAFFMTFSVILGTVYQRSKL